MVRRSAIVVGLTVLLGMVLRTHAGAAQAASRVDTQFLDNAVVFGFRLQLLL